MTEEELRAAWNAPDLDGNPVGLYPEAYPEFVDPVSEEPED